MSTHPFHPLRHRALRLLWSAAVVSDIGTWVQLIVVGSLVAANTGSAVQTGLVALATFMPQGIASPIGGLLADRYDRRKVFATALLGQAAVTGVLAAVLGAGVRDPGVLTLLILVGSAVGALGAPSYQAMLPDLVTKDELMAVVSLGAYSWNAGRIVGPLLGTLLYAAVGPAWTIAFNAATFVLMAGAVSLVRRPFVPLVGDGSIRDRLAGGWRTLRATPGCWHAVVVLVLFNLTVVPFMGLIPIYVRAEFDGGPTLTGVTSALQGVGAITGGIVVTLLAARRSRSFVLSRLIGYISVAFAAFAMAPGPVALGITALFLGAGASSAFITTSAIVQRDAPPHSRGRVLSINQALMGVSYGVGLIVIGSIGDLAGLRVAFFSGAVALLVGCWALSTRSRDWRTAVDGAPVEPSDTLAPALA